MSNKYPNGYFPKIEYWTVQLTEAAKHEDLPAIDYAHTKLRYFIEKQFELSAAADAAYEEQAHLAFYSRNL